MSYSAALEEVFASGDEAGTQLYALELTHSALVGAIRWVMGVGEPLEDAEAPVPLPLAPGGATVDHTPCLFRIMRPGAEKSGPTEGRLQIAGISAEAYTRLKPAIGQDEPIKVVLRDYRAGPDGVGAITGPDGVVEDLELSAVDLDGGMAQGALSFPDGRGLNVPTGPNATFDLERYRTLYA